MLQVSLESKTKPNVSERGPILTPVVHPTILFVTGLQGSGKTTVLEWILSRTTNKARETGIILNERDLMAAKADARRLTSLCEDTGELSVSVLNRCSCCTANKRVTEELSGLLDGGRRLILFEPSGYSDARRLYQGTKDKFSAKAHVRWVHLVNAKRMLGPSHLTNNAILNADAVLISHSGQPVDLERAVEFVRNVREDSKPLLIQSAPGSIGDLWDKVINLTTKPQVFGLPMATEFQPSAKYLEERAALARMLDQQTLEMNPALTTPQSVIEVLSSAELSSVTRAKGLLKLNGQWMSFQYFLSDRQFRDGIEQRNSIVNLDAVVGQIDEKDVGVGKLSITCEEELAVDALLPLGFRFISEDDVSEALAGYPTLQELQDADLRGDELSATVDSDLLFFQAARLDSALDSASYVDQDRFFTEVFDPLLKGFLRYRVDLLSVLKSTVALAPEAMLHQSASLAAASWLLTLTFNEYGAILRDNADVFGSLYQEVRDAKPASTFFDAVQRCEKLDDEPWVIPNDDTLVKLRLIKSLAESLEGYDLQGVSKAIARIKELAGSKVVDEENPSWNTISSI